MTHETQGMIGLSDDVDRVAVSATNRSFQRDVGTFLALTSFDAETERYNQIRQDWLITRERLRQLEDFLSPRIIVLKPDAVVPVHNLDGADDYFFPEDCESLSPEVVWRRNNANYRLALVENEFNSQSKLFFKVSVETRSIVLKEDTFLEFFYKSSESARFRVNSLDHCNGVGIMKCKKVDLKEFRKFHEMLIEYSNLRKKLEQN